MEPQGLLLPAVYPLNVVLKAISILASIKQESVCVCVCVCVCAGMCVNAAQVSTFYILQHSDKEMRVLMELRIQILVISIVSLYRLHIQC